MVADSDAENATAVVTLDQVKRELRIEPDDNDQDDLVQGFVDAAIAYVAKRTGLPLEPRTEVVWISRPTNIDAFVCIGRHATCPELRWWTTSGELRLDSDGGPVEEAQLGRHDAERGLLWPPSGGWPEVLRESQLRISVTRRVVAADVDKSLKQAVVLVARQLYEGYPEVRPTAALNVLINPHVEYLR